VFSDGNPLFGEQVQDIGLPEHLPSHGVGGKFVTLFILMFCIFFGLHVSLCLISCSAAVLYVIYSTGVFSSNIAFALYHKFKSLYICRTSIIKCIQG